MKISVRDSEHSIKCTQRELAGGHAPEALGMMWVGIDQSRNPMDEHPLLWPESSCDYRVKIIVLDIDEEFTDEAFRAFPGFGFWKTKNGYKAFKWLDCLVTGEIAHLLLHTAAERARKIGINVDLRSLRWTYQFHPPQSAEDIFYAAEA